MDARNDGESASVARASRRCRVSATAKTARAGRPCYTKLVDDIARGGGECRHTQCFAASSNASPSAMLPQCVFTIRRAGFSARKRGSTKAISASMCTILPAA